MMHETRTDGGILTPRLLLRPPRMDDAPAIAVLADNAKVAAMTQSLPYPCTLRHARTFVAGLGVQIGDNRMFAVTLADTGALIGCAGICRRQLGAPLEIAYWLGEPFWGRGYGSEIARALVDLWSAGSDREPLTAWCGRENPRARRVLERVGFRHVGEGTIRSIALGRDVPVARFVLDPETAAPSFDGGAHAPARETVEADG